MNFNDTEEFNLTEDVSDIERRFCTFYLTVIRDYFDLDEDFIWVQKDDLNRGRHNYRQNNFYIFQQPDKLLRLCIQDTCLGLRKFYSSVMNYIEIAKYLSKKNLITIYCVLGESLFTALGICIVIDEIVIQYGDSHETHTKQIELIVTVKDRNWKKLCSYIVERINSCYKNVEIKLELIDESSTRLSVEVFRILSKVDIFVMARFLSHFRFLTARTHFLEVMFKKMKELSILFYLDECHEIYYDTLKHSILKIGSLFEIKSQKTIYEPFEDSGNASFFNTAVFEEVVYSTCIKCHGIADNNSFEDDIKENASSLNGSAINLKLKISNRFKKENSHPSSKVKYLTTSKSTNVANGKIGQITASEKGNMTKPSEQVYIANNSPSTSQITAFRDKNKKPSKHPKDRNALPPSTLSNEIKEKSAPNTEIFKHVDTFAFTILQNNYTDSNKEVKPPTNSQNKCKYTKREDMPNAETACEKLNSTNPRTKNKYFKEERKPKSKFVKKSATNSQNKYEYSKSENKSNAKIGKPANEKYNSANLQNKNKYFKEERKTNFKTPKREKVGEKLSYSHVRNNYKYLKANNKSNTATVKRNKDVKTFVFLHLQLKCKYSAVEEQPKKLRTQKRAKLRKNRPQRINKTRMNTNVENTEARKVVQKSTSTNQEYKCPHLKTQESISNYAEILSETYYFREFGKKNKYFSDKIRHIPAIFGLCEYKK